MEAYKDFAFEAAHFLPRAPESHKCKRLHGHSYRVRIWISGPLDQELGWIVDFGRIKERVAPIIAELDHQLLNEVAGLRNPTTENVAAWLWHRLKPALPMLVRIEVRETRTAGVVYQGTSLDAVEGESE